MSGLRVGVIGCGSQGTHHLEVLTSMPGVRVVGIADLDEARLAEVGRRFGVDQRYADSDRLLEQELDFVSVCTMPDSHLGLVVRAVEAGAHVLCEKPLARNASEGHQMVLAAQRADRSLFIGFNLRYLHAVTEVRRFIQKGMLGDLVYARGFMKTTDVPWWGKHYVHAKSGGGALNSSAVHFLDLLMWLAGNPRPLKATASMARIFPSKRRENAPVGAAEAYDVEDLMSGQVRFEGGFWLSIEGSWVSDRPTAEYGFDAIGTNGEAQLEPLELYTQRAGRVVRADNGVQKELDWPGTWRMQLVDVIDAIRNKTISDRLATGRQALAVQAVVDALYSSAREHKEVQVIVPET